MQRGGINVIDAFVLSGMFTEAVAVLGVGVLLWAFQATRPPPPKLCGSKNGPPVTSPRIKLSDGRHLAYKVRGVPKETAKYKVIVIHGFDSSKDVHLPLSQVCNSILISTFLASVIFHLWQKHPTNMK